MFDEEIVDVPAPMNRAPEPSGRFALFVAELRTGAPLPLTRFCETIESVIAAVAPAVTRRPSWPKSGPVVSVPTFAQLPFAAKLMHIVRPMIDEPRICAAFTTPEGVSGGLSFVAPSMRTPSLLYLSMRVLSISRARPGAAGGEVAAVTCATPYPRSFDR